MWLPVRGKLCSDSLLECNECENSEAWRLRPIYISFHCDEWRINVQEPGFLNVRDTVGGAGGRGGGTAGVFVICLSHYISSKFLVWMVAEWNEPREDMFVAEVGLQVGIRSACESTYACLSSSCECDLIAANLHADVKILACLEADCLRLMVTRPPCLARLAALIPGIQPAIGPLWIKRYENLH